MKWGRDDLEWAELVDATADFLVEQASLQRTTSYTELNAVLAQRTDARPFDFDKESERAAMGAMLGEVAVRMREDVGALISAIVLYLNENDAGGGFYRLASALGMLPTKPTADQRLTFWTQQVTAVYARYE
ncbi:hypothetical protein [Nocardioides bizhenqiangii]|uniref:Uncharacterized protein n=1 Tax=Nocardioides bizhenqiangii TaxID=3095076 RepID=A0ABZ0ZSP4_9ACTN|nr:hypothetical protein [Nocardioides sp. HM61]WQQ26821.1 hypothetical protein SHK19_00980 [Nocardioides sp. HM61]